MSIVSISNQVGESYEICSSVDQIQLNQDTDTKNKVIDFARKFFTSPTVMMFGALFGAFLVMPVTFALGLFVLTIGFCACFPKHLPKPLLYELALIDNIAGNVLAGYGLAKRNYYDEVSPGMYIGALPLKSHGHDSLLKDELEVKAVLAVLQDFEMQKETFFAAPVSSDHWESVGITFMKIECDDMKSMSLDELDKAANFIKKHEDSIYIHCKSGRGRSVSVYMAYLMKYKGMSFEEAYIHVKESRPQMKLVTSQVRMLLAYEEQLGNLKVSF